MPGTIQIAEARLGFIHYFTRLSTDIYYASCWGYIVMNRILLLTPQSPQSIERDSHIDTDKTMRPGKPRATWRTPGRLSRGDVYKLRRERE